MASCSQCGKTFSCGCNLIEGKCHVCFSSKSSTDVIPLKKSTTRVVYENTASPPPNTEFDKILNVKSLSKLEKLKRINDILEKARQEYGNQS